MNNKVDKKRRNIIKGLGGVFAASGIASQIPGVQMFNVARASSIGGFTDYKAIVRLEMDGGCDSFNVLMPRDSNTAGSWYRRYRDARGGIFTQSGGMAYAFNDILPVTSSASGSNANITEGDFGLNPEFVDRPIPSSSGVTPGIQTLYNQGDLAFLTNVGSLVEPVSKFDFNNDIKQVPKAVNSHRDQKVYWDLGGSNLNEAIGWGGNLVGKILTGGQDNNLFPPCISIAGQTGLFTAKVFNTNQNVSTFTLDSSGADEVIAFNRNNPQTDAFNEIMATTYSPLFTRAHQQAFNKATSFAETFNMLLSQGQGSTASGDGWGRINVPYQTSGNFDPVDNEYPTAEVTVNGQVFENDLLNQLQAVARLIKISRNPDAMVNATRQVYVVKLRGFDTHNGQMNTQNLPALLAQVSQAVGYFSEALAEIGAENEVTLYSSSEFGRTLSPNGSGTDHGWGGVQFIMGGAVNGGRIYGQHPLMNIDADDDNSMDWSFSRGQYIPTTSGDQMMSTMAQWMGADANDLSVLFPNIGNFSTDDLGFLS